MEQGVQHTILTCGTMVFSKIVGNASVFWLLRQIQSGLCKPCIVIYNTIIDSLSKDKLLPQALKLFSEMKSDGTSPNIITYTALVLGLCGSGQWEDG